MKLESVIIVAGIDRLFATLWCSCKYTLQRGSGADAGESAGLGFLVMVDVQGLERRVGGRPSIIVIVRSLLLPVHGCRGGVVGWWRAS